MNKIENFEKKRIVDLYVKKKLYLAELSRQFNVHPMTIKRVLRENNIKIRSNVKYWKGTKQSDETKRKRSEAQKISMKGKHTSPSTQFKKGHQLSKKSLEKMRKSLTGRKLTKEHIKNCLQHRSPSSLEIKFSNIIKKYDLPYLFVGNAKFFIERKCPDFINCNGKKIAVEVFYRKHKEYFSGGLEKWKIEREKIFNKYGWKIEYFNEIQVNEKEILRRLG